MSEITLLESRALKSENLQVVISAKIDSHLAELKRHECMLEVYKRNIKELYDSVANLFENKLDSDVFNG